MLNDLNGRFDDFSGGETLLQLPPRACSPNLHRFLKLLAFFAFFLKLFNSIFPQHVYHFYLDNFGIDIWKRKIETDDVTTEEISPTYQGRINRFLLFVFCMEHRGIEP
jgi:hypothetical protein